MAKKKAANTLCWFEIPAKKMDRATKFYEKMLGVKLDVMDMDGCQMGMFPAGDGTLVTHKESKPASKGTMVYFDCAPDLAKAQGRVKAAGGKVIQKKMPIGPHGFIAIVQDTEGNHVGLHSMK